MNKVREVNISKEEAQQPYGEVYKIEKSYDEVPVFKWNNYIKSYVFAAFKIDRTHIVAENFTTIPDGYCVHCLQKIEPYKEKYYEKHLLNGDRYCYEWSEETAYCEKCAIERSSKAEINNCLPELVETITEMREDFNYYTTERYADGSEIGELTYQEMMEQKEAIHNR